MNTPGAPWVAHVDLANWGSSLINPKNNNNRKFGLNKAEDNNRKAAGMREREAYSSEKGKRTYREFVSTGLVRACLVASIWQICLELEAQLFGPVFF
jgi:hypothetical protein